MQTGRERRAELEALVERALASHSDGFLTALEESASLDFKEEAGRRTRSGELDPGQPENPEAATKLADEVACFANTPGGGVLVVGIDGKTAEVLGTELDVEWLQQRIYRAVDVTADIVEQFVAGQRVLALYVAESIEPLENTQGSVRWRVGDSCVPVDRAKWWEFRRSRQGTDPMAEPSTLGVGDVPRSTLERVRRLVGADDTETDEALLHRIGAMDTEGRLSQAAVVLLTPPGRVLVDLTILDVVGGEVLNRIEPDERSPLLEQIAVVERACDVANTMVTLGGGFAQESVRRVPTSAVREAILNGVIHRDWNSSHPTEVRWVEVDSALSVRSPGGFTGGVTATNVLTHRHPRHPALADLFRVLGLVEKQGLGVDRMYTAMITLGHRPPRVVETPGPYVLCELAGGAPHLPVLSLMRQVRPEARQRDVRIVLLIDALLHRPFLTDEQAAAVLQTDALSARGAFEAVRQTTVAGTPLLRRYKGVWILGEAAFDQARRARDLARVVPVMPYAGPDGIHDTVTEWLTVNEAITSGDIAELTGAARGTAQRALADLEGDTVRRLGAGRSTRYVRTGGPLS